MWNGALTSSHVSILTCWKWYWDRELTSSDWKHLNIEAGNLIDIDYTCITKSIGTSKWDRSNRNIEPCDFEASSFNCTLQDLSFIITMYSLKVSATFLITHCYNSICELNCWATGKWSNWSTFSANTNSLKTMHVLSNVLLH